MRAHLGFALACTLALACGGDDSGASPADAASADAGLSTTCTGDCREVTLAASFGAVDRSFTRAFFGLSAPTVTDSGDWELYIEASAGGDDACPTESSPTPDYLVVISGLLIPTDGGTVEPGAVTLVDFEGALLPSEPFVAATARSATWVAADPCLACSQGSEPDRDTRFLAVDVDATFPTGSVSGHVFATHCDSLDDL